MAITLETFRSFVAPGIDDRTTVCVGNEEKTALAAERFTSGRPLPSREIRQLEANQDNLYVRCQLLAAIRDSVGEENPYFKRVWQQLFGTAADAVDVTFSSKPLTAREVRVVLSGLDAARAAEQTRAAFEQFLGDDGNLTATFGTSIPLQEERVPPSAQFCELLRHVLLPAAEAELAAHPEQTLDELTGPRSPFGILAGVFRANRSVSRLLIRAAALPASARTAFLRAVSMLSPRMICGLDIRLASVADRLAALKEADFTPAKIFALACPGTKWPKSIPTDVRELTPDQRETLAMARLGPLPDRLKDEMDMRSRAGRNDAEEVGCRLNGCLSLFDCGLARADVERVMADPRAFRSEMIPPSGWLVGEQGVYKGVDEAFDAMAGDLDRMSPRVEIKLGSGQYWRASDAICLENHPYRQPVALKELRRRIEDLCGPDASETMKANVFLCLSQNAMQLDGAMRLALGLGGAGVTGYSFVLSRDDAGNVTVRREMPGIACAAYLTVTHTFHPDGTQEISGTPQFVINPNVTSDQVAQAYTQRLADAQESADREMAEHLYKTHGGAFAALFADERTSVLAAYPRAQGIAETFSSVPGRVFSAYLTEKTDEAGRLLNLPPEEVPGALAALKAELLPRVRVELVKRAIMETCEREADEALRHAAALDGRAIDLGGRPVGVTALRNKLTYLKFEADATEQDIRDACNAVRDRFLADRRAVLDLIKALQGEEAVLREELLRDALEFPNTGRDAVQQALDIARNLPVPEITAADLDENGVREALLRIGAGVRDAYARLDPAKYGAVERGSMDTKIAAYLLRVRRPQLLNLFARLEADGTRRILESLNPDLAESQFAPGSPEYRDFKTREAAYRILRPILDELKIA